MSKTREMKYSCPYCGREFDITVYESVNTEQDPDLRDACLSGDIFRLSCPHCHTDFMIQYPDSFAITSQLPNFSRRYFSEDGAPCFF